MGGGRANSISILHRIDGLAVPRTLDEIIVHYVATSEGILREART